MITTLREHQCWVFQSRNWLSATLLPNANDQKLAQRIQKQLAQSGQQFRQAVQLTRTRGVGIVLGKDPELHSLVPLKALNFLFDALFLSHLHLGGSQGWSLVC